MKFSLFDSVTTVLGSMIFLATGPALAISVDPLGSSGRVELWTPSFTIGSGGEVFQLEAFINAAGADLNGPFQGTSGQIGVDDPFDGYDITFGSALSDGDTDITLSYDVVKVSGAAQQVTFLSYLDAEIDVLLGGLSYDEQATVHGTLAPGQGYEIDEPGFLFGDILDNLYSGVLDGDNALESFGPEDVSMALSFDLGVMDIGDSAVLDIMISEDNDHIGGFWITQTDSVPITDTEITYSGQLRPAPAIPEPSSALVFAVGVLLTTGAIRNRR
ncbi:MAG: hypothetical protein VX681_17785 [Myxococcota bacterium]|nr:hypothetical protein [Myxococcota bacterium]